MVYCDGYRDRSMFSKLWLLDQRWQWDWELVNKLLASGFIPGPSVRNWSRGSPPHVRSARLYDLWIFKMPSLASKMMSSAVRSIVSRETVSWEDEIWWGRGNRGKVELQEVQVPHSPPFMLRPNGQLNIWKLLFQQKSPHPRLSSEYP